MKSIIQLFSKSLLGFLLVGLISQNVTAQLFDTELINESLRTGSIPSGWTQNKVSFTTAAQGYARFESATDASLTTASVDLFNLFGTYTLTGSVAKFGTGADGNMKIEVSYDGGPFVSVGNTPTVTSATYMDFSLTLPGVPSLYHSVIIRFTNNSLSEKRLRDIVLTQSGILPITLSSFTASNKHNKAELVWSTAKEINSSHFEIQRSQDGKTFKQIGKVISKNMENGADYSFTDNAQLSETVYYRLKSVDFDGKFEMSKIVSVHFANKNTLELAATLVNNQLPIRILNSQEGPVSYFITDLNGRILLSAENVSIAERSQIDINISSLTSGMYILKTKLSSTLQTYKFVKQ